jgi:hypothetical protein
MPRVIRCEGCQQSHLIREQLVGWSVRCDCGHTQAIPASAPSVPASTGWLDKPVVQVGSVGLLLVSLLVLGGVVAWVVGLEVGPDSPSPPVPPTTYAASPTTRPAPPTTRPATPTTHPAPSTKENSQLLALLEQLKAPDLENNNKALKALLELEPSAGRPAIPAVVAAARRHDDEKFRQLAAQVLKELGAPRSEDLDCLKDALEIPHQALQRYVLWALKEMGEQARGAMPVVVEALKHRDPEVRREAVVILKTLGPAARVPAFRLLLNPVNDADEEASLGVLKALLDEAGRLAPEEADVLAEALRDGKRRDGVRYFAADRLGAREQAARAVPALVDVLRQKGNVKLLTLSIRALARIGDRRQEVLTSLVTLATSAGEEEVRLESLRTLEQLGSSTLTTAQVLERWNTEKGRGSVRQVLARLLKARLEALKAEQMKELLLPLGHEAEEIVLVGLEVVRDRKGDAAEVAVEVARLLKEGTTAGVREAAVEALQALGPAADKALPELNRVLLGHWASDKEPAVREALARLLKARLEALKAELSFHRAGQTALRGAARIGCPAGHDRGRGLLGSGVHRPGPGVVQGWGVAGPADRDAAGGRGQGAGGGALHPPRPPRAGP